MIDKFGQVMLYVLDVEKSANFWIENLEFTKVSEMVHEGKLISLELCPYNNADTHLVLFDKEFVMATSPLASLGTPSLLFSTYNINETHQKMKAKGVAVSEISDMEGIINFHFPDPENNFFAIREISK